MAITSREISFTASMDDKWWKRGKTAVKTYGVDDRFWGNIRKGTNCWIWVGSKQRSGYGQLKFLGAVMLAHRASWILNFGAIPDGMQVLHKCDVRRCVNPAHLFLGTPKDNIADMIAKGRARLNNPQPGELAGMAKLTEYQVKSIKRHLANGKSLASLGRQYGVTFQNIWCIKHGKSWTHVA